jgi:S1-C subfamily serine protease
MVGVVASSAAPAPQPSGKSSDDIIQENEKWIQQNFGSSSDSPKSVINPIVLTVSLIVQIKDNKPIGSASGFFYGRGEDLFLVTNQHVMRDDQAKNDKGNPAPVIPDFLRLRLHTDQNDVRKVGDFDVPLYKGKDRLWKIHSDSPMADVALLKLDSAAIKKHFVVKAWSKESFLPKNYTMAPGEDVFVIGYPFAFHDVVFNLPIFRSAMIASTYGVPFRGAPLFLTDANLHPGTSGSPVITKPKSTWVDDQGNTNVVTGTVYYLVGVHSGTVSKDLTGGQDIGLGAAWYAELIEDIASRF